MLPTVAEERERVLMLAREPLYDVVRRVNDWRIILRARAKCNGTHKESEWVLSKGFIRKPQECVVCRHVYRAFEKVRMYKPPVNYPQDMRCCEPCGGLVKS